jgi:hypothetical protein
MFKLRQQQLELMRAHSRQMFIHDLAAKVAANDPEAAAAIGMEGLQAWVENLVTLSESLGIEGASEVTRLALVAAEAGPLHVPLELPDWLMAVISAQNAMPGDRVTDAEAELEFRGAHGA